MNVVPVPHPRPEELAAFALGQLPPAAREQIETHIARCEACCQALLRVPDDSLLDRLRQGPPPCAPTRLDALDPSAVPGLPAELVRHPRYHIVQELGAGGMGVVYKAEHRLLQRTVALKVINQRYLKERTAVERFRLEAQSAARLSHPNLVTVFDADAAGPIHFLVMEYVDGVNLAGHVERRGPLPVGQACMVVRQAALGLHHAHERGMIHRDVKPHNLMVTRQGGVKVLDFGLARLMAADGETQSGGRALTAVDVVLGTPDFLSPEQAHNSPAIDRRSDLYSLGCTFYFLLTGRVPFPSDSAMEKLILHRDAAPTPVAQLRPQTPPEVAAVVQKLMAKRPEDRYQTATEVAEALAPLARSARAVETAIPVASVVPATEPIHAHPLRDTEKAGTPGITGGPPRRKRWWAAGLAGLVALAALGLMVMGGKGGRPGGTAAGKRVLFYLPPRDFGVHDYAPARRHLEAGGAKVLVCSTQWRALPALWAGGGDPVDVDVLLDGVDPNEYDALVIGGVLGPRPLQDHKEALGRLARDFHDRGKPVAASGHGPLILAHQRVLGGKRATCHPGVALQVQGFGVDVDLEEEVVVAPARDGKGRVITSRDSAAAPRFAQAVLEAMRRAP